MLRRARVAAEAAIQGFTFNALSSRLFELMALIEETASQGLEARVAAFLLRRSKGETEIAMTQEQIARHLLYLARSDLAGFTRASCTATDRDNAGAHYPPRFERPRPAHKISCEQAI